jgi:hypothetical protein
MPTKRSGSPVESKPTYAEWRARCAALLERQGISAGFMREKEWRKLFIQGSPPEDVVRHAEVLYHNTRPSLERTTQAMSADLPFRVVRSNTHDETLARCTNLPIAQAAYRAAARMYPEDLIELRQGARIVEKSR